MNSLLSTSLARHGRRRIRPSSSSSSSIIQPSPLLGSNWGNTNDDDDDTTSNSRRRISLAHGHQCRTPFAHQPTSTHHLTSQSSTSTSTAAASRRNYHSTSKQQILPFLAVGILGAGVIYTYRTFQQIDDDWEEYYHELEEYKAVTGIDPEAAGQDGAAAAAGGGGVNAAGANAARVEDDLSHYFTGGILAIDMGTTRLKLSHRPSLSHVKNQTKPPPSPSVSVNREGFRSTPSLVWMPPSSSSNNNGQVGEQDEEMLVGRMAMERSYDTKGGTILRPRASLLDYSKEGGASNTAAEAAIRQSIRSVATNALDQVLGTNNNSGANAGSSPSSSANNTNPLFVLDESMSARGSGSYNVRPILTYPPSSDANGDDYLTQYRQSVNGLTSPAGIAEFVPEPVAIVCGAEYYNLLPSKDAGGSSSVLVVDAGGTSTCVSIVGGEGGKEEVLYSATLPFGGDTFVDLLVSHLVDGFYGTTSTTTNNSDDDESSRTTHPSSKPTLNDPSALQRLYEASTTAIHELSNKTRSEINIPYLTMDLQTRQPKHLEVGVSRNVVDAEVQTWVREKLVPYLLQGTTTSLSNNNNNNNNSLSQALPSPTNLSTLFSSAIMNSLECTSLTPHALRAVILVGGGARVPLLRESMREGLVHLAGDAYVSGSGGNGKGRLIMPEGEMGEELGVLGAAVWGSGGR